MGSIRRMSAVLHRVSVVTVAVILAIAFALPVIGQLRAQGRATVRVIPIDGTIDLGLAPFVRRVLADAKRDGDAAVILQINTFGGRLDAAVAIRDELLSSDVQTVAWVNRRAISAGALIGLAANRIVMTDGGTIGAATPVMVGAGGESSPVDEKSVSYVRKEFRATADARNRPAEIAEAMVDADVEIEGLIEKGKLLTMTTEEALERGVADAKANDLDAVLEQIGLSGATVVDVDTNWGEEFVRLITSPVLASLLLSLAVIGILVEIRTPGFGVAGAVGLSSLALVMGGHWAVALVGWEEVLLVGIGLLLVALEVFVIPGFGIAGIGGALGITAGLVLGLIGEGATVAAVASAAGRVALSLTMGLVMAMVLFRYLITAPVGRKLVLDYALPRGAGDDDGGATATATLLGKIGKTLTPLRPSGLAEIDGNRLDVVSTGEMLDSGVAVEVTRVDGNRIVVRAHRAPSPENAQ